MTLALYGKSRKRQGGLLLAALLAIIGAAVGGLLLVGTAFAHTATLQTSCTEVKVSFTQFDDKGTFNGSKNTPHVSIAVDGSAATVYDLSFSGKTYNFQQSVSPISSYTVRVYWTPSDLRDNYQNGYDSNVQTIDCTRDVRVQKVTDTQSHPVGSFNIIVGTLTFSHVQLAKDASSSDISSAQTLSANSSAVVGESDLPSGWSQPSKSYYVKKYSSAGTDCSSVDGDKFKASATVPADTSDYIVCVKNVYTPTGTIQVHKYIWDAAKGQWKPNTSQGQGGVDFHYGVNEVTNSDWEDIAQGTGNGAGIDLPVGNYTVFEKAKTGYQFVAFYNAGNNGTECNNGAPAGPNPNPAPPTTVSVTVEKSKTTHVCAYNRAAPPTITKSKTGTTGVWTITVSNPGPDAVDVYISDTGAAVSGNLPSGCSTVVNTTTDVKCTVPGNGSKSFNVSKTVPAQTCSPQELNNSASLYLGSTKTGNPIETAGGDASTKFTIAASTDPACTPQPDLIATKTNSTASGSITQGGNFDWQIVVKNQGTANAVFAQNSQVFVDNMPSGPTYSNLQTTGTTTNLNCGLSSGTISCTASGGSFTLAPNGTFTMAVHVVPAADFVGGLANPAADGKCKVDPTNTNGVVAESNENNNTCSDSVVVTAPQVVYRTVTVCKVMDDNSNGIPTEGGTFGFHVDDGSQTHDVNLTAKEGDAADAHCQTYENVSSTHSVTITESLPTNWDSAANYPTVTGASSVNGMTATLNAGTAPATVTFHNKLNVFSGACFIEGGSFLALSTPPAPASHGYWFGLNTYDYFNGDGHNAGLPVDPNGATAGNAFDHRWVQVVDNGSGNKLVWKLASGQGTNSVVVYPSVDHNDAGGTTGGSIAGEANEYFVWGSNDGITWEQATGSAPFDPTPGAYIADNAARQFTFPGGHVWNMIGISVNLGANVGTDAEIDAVCGMSQPLSRKLTVIKDVDNVANDSQTFPIYLDGSQIGSVAETDSPKFSKDISTNSQTFTEGIADGYSYVGGYVSAVDGQCVKPGVEIEDLAQFVIDLLTSTGIKIPEGTDNLTVCLVNHSEKTIKVHITKYLDGKQATAASANNYSFPMSATWSATNIGAGTGSYVLGPAGHGGSGPYAADTSPMTVGASYSTYETLSTSCTAGQPYRLIGYKTDTSGFPTNSSGASTETPSFTDLQADQYITVFNESCKGTLYVIKKTQGVTDPHGATFSGTVDSSNSQTWGPLTNGGMSSGISVAAGEHTIQEAPASQDPGLWTAEGLNYATGENHTCPADPDPALTKPNVPAGGTTYVCIYNLRKAADELTGTVKVIKTVVGNNPDPNQSFTINVQSGSASLKNNGSATFNFSFSTDSPTWNVTGIGETNVPAHYTLLGYKIINGGALSCDSDATTLAGLVSSVPTLEISAQHTAYTVCVYNRGYGSITVTKTTTVNGVVDGTQNAGWKITVSSAACSFNQTQNTNSSGVVAFTNLPTCNDYVVSEDVNSHGNSGFAPVGPSSYGSIAVTAGGNAAVAFTNNRFVPPPCAAFNGCNPVILNTPTATPTTPTATATQPTQKPTEPTKTEKPEEPKKTPTVDIILGEKTPGANATPLAPQTGSGLFGTGKSGSNLLLAVLGIFSLSAGFAVIAVANKNKSRS